jgi:microsomal dipeptidase-like Zn-dependent dipeptidase
VGIVSRVHETHQRGATRRRRAAITFALIALLAHGVAGIGVQRRPGDGDFDDWIAEGDAFIGQPVNASTATTTRLAPITVGGDYWRDLLYPLGQDGDSLVMSGAASDAAVGRFISPVRTLEPEIRFFSMLIGGSRDVDRVRVELQVNMSPGPFDPRRAEAVFRASGDNHEQLTPHVWRVPDELLNREARVVIVDESTTGHINVDAVRFAAEPPPPRSTPVWGFADYHTHPMTYLAFGALKGVRTIWGRPGGRYDDYKNAPGLVALDYPACEKGHGGGPYAGPFLNGAQKLQYKETPDLLIRHPNHGWPDFKNFPSFIQGAHEQMHVTQIRRSFDGGLRLLVALTTDNVGAEYLMSSIGEDGHVPLVAEKASLTAQLAAMKDLAQLNTDWMQIAYSPAEARDIILRGKLAVILGIEMDQLGTYGCSTPAEEVQYLWDLGVRAVTPIHAADNKLGGASVFIGPYNWLNDLMHRDVVDVSLNQLRKMDARFFEIDEQPCGTSSANDGECIQNKLEWNKQQRLYIGTCVVSFLEALFRKSPCLDRKDWPLYDTTGGHANKHGLTPYGEQYVDALIAKGMILDLAHMSEKSVGGTFAAIGRKLQRDHADCAGFPRDTSPGCDARAYPAIISHAHFRGQAFYGEKDFQPSEYDISNRTLELVRRVGGVVGPFVAEDRVSTEWDAPRAGVPDNDCAMSSKSFAYSFHYAAQRLARYGVGLATDFTFIPGVAPRFGDDACWGYNLARDPRHEQKQHGERYNIKAQTSGVVYTNEQPEKKRVKYAANVALMPYTLNTRVYDYNVDGLAHYGLLPDMLQDLKNVGMPDEDRALLFRSAEDYIRMWERVLTIAR